MFTTGNEERCPVMLFKRYLEERPSERPKSDPFYLTVNKKLASSISYKKTPVRKDATNTTIKSTRENSPLRDLYPEKNLTNHSARRPRSRRWKVLV